MFVFRRIAVLFLCLSSAPLWAQEFRASVTGVVRDPQGAVVAGAEIVARNLETNKTDQTASSGAGYYALPVLDSGNYMLPVSAPGFKKAVKDRLELRVGDKVQQDFVLEIGALSDQVTVTGEAAAIHAPASGAPEAVNDSVMSNRPVRPVLFTMRRSTSLSFTRAAMKSSILMPCHDRTMLRPLVDEKFLQASGLASRDGFESSPAVRWGLRQRGEKKNVCQHRVFTRRP